MTLEEFIQAFCHALTQSEGLERLTLKLLKSKVTGESLWDER
jgi:hypothetical protein